MNKARWPKLFVVLVCGLPMMVNAELPSSQRQQALMHLLKQDCGSCHGLTLQGGLGPALTPQALAGKSPDDMVVTVMYGRTGTPMPPWSNQLSEDEVKWIVQQLYRGVDDAK